MAQEPDREQRALEAVALFAGVSQARAKALIDAVKDVAAAEALEVITGQATVYGSLADTRVERLRRIALHLQRLGAKSSGGMLTAYELASLWRVTESQARALLRTWRARHPEIYEETMRAAVAASKAETGGGKGQQATWVVSCEDPDLLVYAETLARRSGLSKGLRVDGSSLTIEAPKSTRSDDGDDLKQVLGIK